MKILKVFTAPWCGPCKAMQPALDQLASEGLLVTKVDVDANPAVAAIHGIRAVPTLKFYVDDNLMATKTGAMSIQQLRDFTKS